MQNITTLLPSLFFLGAGGMLGAWCCELLHGHFRCLTAFLPAFWFTMVANPICWFVIWRLGKRVQRERALRAGDDRLRFSKIVIRGLPFTHRVAFLAFTTLWSLGFLIGLLWPFFDKGTAHPQP